MKRFLTSALFFGVILLFWQSLVSSGHWSPLILPSPADVIKYVLNGIADGDIVTGSWVTCKR
jgi:ABC-type nitrate/sulfonate/bicarbonate transport system permease component